MTSHRVGRGGNPTKPTKGRTMIGDAAICEGRISKDCRSHVREPPRDIFIHFEPTDHRPWRSSVRPTAFAPLSPFHFFGMANGGQGKKEREMETDPADRKEGRKREAGGALCQILSVSATSPSSPIEDPSAIAREFEFE